jgi:hypothetical protein
LHQIVRSFSPFSTGFFGVVFGFAKSLGFTLGSPGFPGSDATTRGRLFGRRSRESLEAGDGEQDIVRDLSRGGALGPRAFERSV